VSRQTGPDVDLVRHGLRETVSNTLFISRTFYTHSKILVTALNGPVVGVAAALVACSDFIYCLPHTYLLTPFSSLGLVTEGASSMMLAHRMGLSKAKEALITSRRIPASELLACGFVNKMLDIEAGNTERFLAEALHEIEDTMGSHLNDSSMLNIKGLMSGRFQREVDAQNVEELFRNLERQVAGIPQKEFEKMRTGQKRHKL
jgi:Delta3-Delta2-enoyl-CoA isomerase